MKHEWKKHEKNLYLPKEKPEIEDGLSVQILHVGSYDDEPKSFQLMKSFIADNNLEIVTLQHREIYISDVRKVEPSKLKTVLRYSVKSKI